MIVDISKLQFKGTPGPWHVVEHAGYHMIKNEPYYEGLNLLDEEDVEGDAIKNATLAAAAPDLLQACQSILEYLKVHGMNGSHYVEQLETAIKKALA